MEGALNTQLTSICRYRSILAYRIRTLKYARNIILSQLSKIMCCHIVIILRDDQLINLQNYPVSQALGSLSGLGSMPCHFHRYQAASKSTFKKDKTHNAR